LCPLRFCYIVRQEVNPSVFVGNMQCHDDVLSIAGKISG